MSNEVVIPDYLKKFMETSTSKDADSMASASVSVPRISLKGKKFQFINGDDESKKTEDIHVIILGVDPEGGRMIKTFYANGYNPNDTSPPDCSSSNGIAPDNWVQNPVSTNCAGCDKNRFGSATSPSGKKTKACRDAKRLWVVKADEVGETVYGLNVPVTSLKAMAEYGKEIREAGIPLSAVITRVYMDEESEFPQIHFQRIGFLVKMAPDQRRLIVIDQLGNLGAALLNRCALLLSLFRQRYGRRLEQHSARTKRRLNQVFALNQRRQDVFRIIKAKIRRLAHRPRPRTNPSPERYLRMPLEAPLRSLAVHATSRAVVLVVLEEAIEHVHVAHKANSLGRSAELNEIVWRCRCRAKQSIRNLAHEFSN